MKKARVGSAGAGGDYGDSIADGHASCPLACMRHHAEELYNRRGEVRATECALCGQIVARTTWADLLTRPSEAAT